jgi:hypothetical protein
MSDTDDRPKVRLVLDVSEETLVRLQNLSDFCHADPRTVAASLLHDILKDDEDAHILTVSRPPGSTLN